MAVVLAGVRVVVVRVGVSLAVASNPGGEEKRRRMGDRPAEIGVVDGIAPGGDSMSRK